MRVVCKRIAVIISLAICVLLGLILYFQQTIPDRLYLSKGEHPVIHSLIEVSSMADPLRTADEKLSSFKADLKLLGSIQIKSVQVSVVQRQYVIPAGTAFGIKMFTHGVMVVGQSDIRSANGLVNPSKEAGIQTGDVILSINGKTVESNEDVGKIVADSSGAPLCLELQRQAEQRSVSVRPVQDREGVYRLGIWVRDSSAGIGTMTYYDPINRIYTGLGHAICDVDTGEIMPLSTGEIVPVTVTGLTRGERGAPGELKGMFKSTRAMGDILSNRETGIFGHYYDAYESTNDPVPLAYSYEVEEGKATIYATLDAGAPQAYEIEIEKILTGSDAATKNMILHVTDPALLERTGGIVQGMSGCPILQNGKLVGAVTHVFVNDPTRGYGIFIENMAEMTQAQNRAA